MLSSCSEAIVTARRENCRLKLLYLLKKKDINVIFLASDLRESDYKISMSEACFCNQITLQGDLNIHENTYLYGQPCIIFKFKITAFVNRWLKHRALINIIFIRI